MNYLFYLILFLIGAACGSFLNALIWRTHRKLSVMRGRSKCIHCEVILRASDLVPILSYVVLFGKCRSCKKFIPTSYIIVELVTALGFVGLAYWHGLNELTVNIPFLRDAILLLIFEFIFIYDLKYMKILDRATTVPAIIYFVLASFLGWQSPIWMLTGVGTAAGFFLVQYFLSNGKWIGGGDIRFALLMGVVLGFPGTIVGLALAYLIGAIFGAYLLMSGKKKREAQLPFGTFLVIGSVIAYVYASEIVTWYVGLL